MCNLCPAIFTKFIYNDNIYIEERSMVKSISHLSKIKYCKAVQCKKILWLDKYKEEEKITKANEIEEKFRLISYERLPN